MRWEWDGKECVCALNAFTGHALSSLSGIVCPVCGEDILLVLLIVPGQQYIHTAGYWNGASAIGSVAVVGLSSIWKRDEPTPCTNSMVQ